MRRILPLILASASAVAAIVLLFLHTPFVFFLGLVLFQHKPLEVWHAQLWMTIAYSLAFMSIPLVPLILAALMRAPSLNRMRFALFGIPTFLYAIVSLVHFVELWIQTEGFSGTI